MKLVGSEADLMINGDKTLDTIGTTDASYLTITTKVTKKQLTITFPNKYNEGMATTAAIALKPTATKTVKIKVSNVPNGTQEIYVDYLFETLTVTNKYFVYDPDAKDTTAALAAAAAAGGTASEAYHVSMFF